MKLNLAPFWLAAAVAAVPAPQMGEHSHGNGGAPPTPKWGVGDVGGFGMSTLMGAMVKMMPPLTLSKTVKAQPISKKQGVIREQLYYGPLMLKPVSVKW